MNQRRRVLLITAADPTRAYSCVKYLFNSLKDKNIDITLWATVPKEEISGFKEWGKNAHSFYHTFYGSYRWIRRFCRRIHAFILCIHYRNEVIICHELTFYAMAVKIKKLFKRTLLIHYNTEVIDGSYKMHRKLFKQYKKNVNAADLIIECNEERATYRKTKFEVNTPAVVIYNTIPSKETANIEIREISKKLRVVYSGGAFEYMKLDQIFSAIAEIDLDFELQLFLYGDKNVISDIIALFQEKYKDKEVKIQVNLPRENIFEQIYRADVGVVCYDPSINAGSNYAAPTKFFEYIALNIPIVSYPNESLKKIIEKYDIGLCLKDNNPASFAEPIQHLLENRKRVEEMKKNEEKCFREDLCYEKQSKTAIDRIIEMIM